MSGPINGTRPHFKVGLDPFQNGIRTHFETPFKMGQDPFPRSTGGMAGPKPGPAWPEGLAWTARSRLGARPAGEPGQGSEIFSGLGRAGTDFTISRAGRDNDHEILWARPARPQMARILCSR